MSLTLAGLDTPDSIGRELLKQMASVVGVSSGGIFLVEEQGTLRLVASQGNADSRQAAVLEAVASWAADSGDLLLTDPHRGAAMSASTVHTDPHDLLAIPFRLDERVVGVAVLMRGMEAQAFSERERSLVTVLGTEAALAIERYRIQNALESRIDELHLARRQMEAYALDVRNTFAAEKERAEQLAEALSELEETYLATVRGLAVAVEAKDAYTAGHIVRVTRYGLMMMKLVAPDQVADPQFEYGFLLHDIGKLAVPDAVLGKQGPLNEHEWEVMRLHPDTGRKILEGIPFLTGAKEIVYAHHERWDGKGYPSGLRSDEIPLGAGVFPIADSFDAMTSDRPYRRAMPIGEAIEEISNGERTQFWPVAVEAFLNIPVEELESVQTSSTSWDPLRRG